MSDWLCYLGFHKKVTASDKVTDNTTNHTDYCKRCGIILNEYGTTTFSLTIEVPKEEQP